MNFLLHQHFAERDLERAAAGFGAMLPDLWRMVDRRVRARSDVATPTDARAVDDLGDVLRGIAHHLDVDLWFHEAVAFTRGERRTADALAAARIRAKKLSLFAHPLWEMCLDGALVRREGAEVVRARVARARAEGATAAIVAAELHHFADARELAIQPNEGAGEGEQRATRGAFFARLDELLDALCEGPWIAGYGVPFGLTRALEGMRTRFGMPRFEADERSRVEEAIAGLEREADEALEVLLMR